MEDLNSRKRRLEESGRVVTSEQTTETSISIILKQINISELKKSLHSENDSWKDFILLNLESGNKNSTGIIIDWKDKGKEYSVISNDEIDDFFEDLFNRNIKEKILSMECLYSNKIPRMAFFTITPTLSESIHEFNSKCSRFKKELMAFFRYKKGVKLNENDFVEHVFYTDVERSSYVVTMILPKTIYYFFDDQKYDLGQFLMLTTDVKEITELKIDVNRRLIFSQKMFQVSEEKVDSISDEFIS